jgi:Ser/Thr protein kinase RdoA (MazF antagonist)
MLHTRARGEEDRRSRHAARGVFLRGDGRLLQLNSYENRVFQVMLEDGRAVVAKFYRPGRWSDAQILEEHAFARELAEAMGATR